MTGEFVKIHVERFRIGENGLSDNMACAEHTISATQLEGIQGRVLEATVWKLIEQTKAGFPEDNQ